MVVTLGLGKSGQSLTQDLIVRHRKDAVTPAISSHEQPLVHQLLLLSTHTHTDESNLITKKRRQKESYLESLPNCWLSGFFHGYLIYVLVVEKRFWNKFCGCLDSL